MSGLKPERIHELAIHIAVQRAQRAVKQTIGADIIRELRNLDDVAPLPYDDRKALYDEVSSLVRTAQIVVTFPQLYVGKGDGEPADLEPEDDTQ